jgi:hypothetical protein
MEKHSLVRDKQTLPTIPRVLKPNRRLSMLGQHLLEVNHNLRAVT